MWHDSLPPGESRFNCARGNGRRTVMYDAQRAKLRAYNEQVDWEILNGLIGRIYECALHPEYWNDTLDRIKAALCPLNWEAAFLLWEGQDPPHAEFIAATGLAAGVQEMYTSVYAGSHPWSKPLMRYRNGSVVDSDELMSREEFSKTPFARDFLTPWGIDRLVAVLLDRRGKERLGLMLPGPGDRDVEVLKRGLRVLAPHIQRAVRISHRIASLEMGRDAALAAADTAPYAVVSLDPGLNILAANRLLRRYEKAGAVTADGGKLAFTNPASQQSLLDLLAKQPPAGLAFQAILPDGREVPVLGARIAETYTRPLGGIVAGTAIIVTIGSGPGETPVVEIDRVAQWFNLTSAEARLSVAISNGTSVGDYAAERAVSTNAVRFLLKSIFRKTGAVSQAQLAVMVARLPAQKT
jgi:DNA-binding CsgD family transcriptional regulator